MAKLELKIVTPERQVLSLEVDEVVLPSHEGYLGVLPGHAPLLCQLDIGEISYRVGNERHYLAASGGFAEVLREGVTVLATNCEPAEEIDLERARRAQKKAEEQLSAEIGSYEFRRAEVHLKRAIARIHVHGQARGMMS